VTLEDLKNLLARDSRITVIEHDYQNFNRWSQASIVCEKFRFGMTIFIRSPALSTLLTRPRIL